MLTLKWVYEPAAPEDGFRVLVERRWPSRLDKGSAAIDS
jgi:ribokinase